MKPLKWFVSITIRQRVKKNVESLFFFLRKIILLNLIWKKKLSIFFIRFDLNMCGLSFRFSGICVILKYVGFYFSFFSFCFISISVAVASSIFLRVYCLRRRRCLSSFCSLINYQSTITSYNFFLHQYTKKHKNYRNVFFFSQCVFFSVSKIKSNKKNSWSMHESGISDNEIIMQ